MRAQAVETVMMALGSYNPTPNVNSAGAWGTVSCPLAPFTHGGGRDKNPSMMVSVDEGRSHAKCLSCQFSGGVRSLAEEMYRHGGITADELEDLKYFILLEETKHYEQLKMEGGLQPEIRGSMIEDLGRRHPYWTTERGLKAATIRSWGLGFSYEEMRALVPFWDLSGSLVGVVGRDVTGESDRKYMIYPAGFDRGRYLFGEHRITGREEAVLMVEGYMDAVTASEYLPENIGVVAVGSAMPTDEQLRRVALLAPEVILALDSDVSGTIAAAKSRRKLGPRVKLSTIDLGAFKDADEAKGAVLGMLLNRRNAVTGPLEERMKEVVSRRPVPKRLQGGQTVDKGKWTI